MANSDQGIVKDQRGEEQPRDKQRAQTVHKTNPKGSPSREATRDPKLNDDSKTPGSGAMPDGSSGIKKINAIYCSPNNELMACVP